MMSCLPVPVCTSEDSVTHAPPPGPASLKGCTPLTLARAGEVVVILGHVGHDAEAVRDTHGDHVTGVQESRDSQLLLSHFKGLGACRCQGGGRFEAGGGNVWGGGQVQGWEKDGGCTEAVTSRKRKMRQGQWAPLCTDPALLSGMRAMRAGVIVTWKRGRSGAPGTSGPEGSRGWGEERPGPQCKAAALGAGP